MKDYLIGALFLLAWAVCAVFSFFQWKQAGFDLAGSHNLIVIIGCCIGPLVTWDIVKKKRKSQ